MHSFGVSLYIYIYICHPQTYCFVVSQLFSVARHVGRFKRGLKSAQHYVRLNIIPLSQQSTYVSSGMIRHYVVAFASVDLCCKLTLLKSSNVGRFIYNKTNILVRKKVTIDRRTIIFEIRDKSYQKTSYIFRCVMINNRTIIVGIWYKSY